MRILSRVTGGAGTIMLAGLAIYLLTNQAPADTGGSPLVAVVVPDLGAAERVGEAVYDAKCGSCHGDDASGQDGVAPPLVHRIYEPSHHGDRAFLVAAQLGARAHHWRFGDMPPVDGITETEIASVVAYVRALQRANGID